MYGRSRCDEGSSVDSHGSGAIPTDSRTQHASTIGESDIHSFAIGLRNLASLPLDHQARWARNRCTVPDTPLSSTGPMSPNAIPVSCEASATAWLTSTSPCRA